jgi:hypothetical protein
MNHFEMKAMARRTLSIGGAVALTLALIGCETIEQERRAERYEDAARKCSNYGAREGSRAYSDCMYRQHRRDRGRDH